MLNYSLHPAAEDGYIAVKAEFSCSGVVTELVFPAWRPGRYELGDFAKNVKDFKITANGKSVKFSKIEKNRWAVQTNKLKKIEVSYLYYARELNAGSSYVGSQFFYVNPVNLLVYPAGAENEPCTLGLPEFKEKTYVGALPFNRGSKLRTASLHELFDSPFLFSLKVKNLKYTVEGVSFYVWFCGESKVDEKKVLTDFEKFSRIQLEAFGSFPFKEYHFINIIQTQAAYHGVEHLNSTVITLGPSWQLMGNLYPELLGISSHELYHAWNIKTIRPAEMQPYDYSRENYSHMGYLAEGVTTYMGDLMLFASAVYNEKQYLSELQNQLTRHFHNPGRLHLSVAESSFDTWLDGYVAGAPGRKVSIYTEGCLVAFLLDVFILQATANKKTLDDVMRMLYVDYGRKGKGVNEKYLLKAIRQITKIEPKELFDNLVYGTTDYKSYLEDAFKYLGLVFKEEKSTLFTERWGIKVQGNKVLAVMENSTAHKSGIEPGDELVSINRIKIDQAEGWLNYFAEEKVEISVLRNGIFRRMLVKLTPNRHQYYTYKLIEKESPSPSQKTAFERWKNRNLNR